MINAILNKNDKLKLTALESGLKAIFLNRKFYLSMCVGGSDAAVNERCVGGGEETLMCYRDDRVELGLLSLSFCVGSLTTDAEEHITCLTP